MEEYFPPIGTDHQILEGQEAGFSLNRFAILLIGTILLLIICVISFFTWQRRVTFLIPDTQLSIVLPKDAQHELKAGATVTLSSDWKTGIPESRSTILIGGDEAHPTWLLAPVWTKRPASFKTIKRHGLYRLSGLDSEKELPTYALSMRSAHIWMEPLDGALGAFRVHTLSSTPEPLFFAWDKQIMKSSIAFSTKGTLSDRDDVSYALQQNNFDSAFLHSVELNHQGLSPWRKELTRVSWTGSESNRSWELIFANTSSPAIPLLSANASSTYSDLLMLRDGSGTRVYKGSSTSTTTDLRIGALPETSSVICHRENFHPFLRLRGQATSRTLPITPFINPSNFRVFEVGSLDNFLSVCFE